MARFLFADLFAGIGGFHLAMTRLGGRCVMAAENDRAARKAYEANYRGHDPVLFDSGMFIDDVTKLEGDLLAEVPDFDVVCAGFPCQSFSHQGRRLGFNDPKRGNLFFDIMRIVDAKRPRALFLENVRNLVTIHGGDTFARIREEIEGRGYEFSSKVIRATDHGLPQHRPRIYMVAFDRETVDVEVPFAFPKPTPLRITMDEVWGGRQCARKIGYTLRVGGRGSPYGDRHNWDSYLVGNEVKRLGPLEGRRMMGFPDDHVLSPVLSQAMKQLGNSVAVDTVQAIGASLTDYLDAHDRRTTVVSVNDMQTGAAETAHAI